MIINIDDLKKKIIYRATYRGTKEMDKLLISFVKKFINTFNQRELVDLNDLLKLEDENLFKFNQGEELTVEIKKNNVSELFKSFVFKNE